MTVFIFTCVNKMTVYIFTCVNKLTVFIFILCEQTDCVHVCIYLCKQLTVYIFTCVNKLCIICTGVTADCVYF